MALGLHPRGSRRRACSTAPYGAWSTSSWVQPKRHMTLSLPRPEPNSILDPALLGSRLALGHTCEYQSQSAIWHLNYSQEKASQAPRVPTWFFHSNNSFLKLLMMIIIFMLL